MKQVTIKAYTEYREQEILGLYRSVGWSAYYSQPEVLRRAFANSLAVFAAWDGERLAGLIRVIGDGETVVFIQDLLVQPDYQRQGIGTMLIGTIRAKFTHVRQMHLMTDDTPRTVSFYKACGFLTPEEVHCRAFTKA